MFHLTSSNVEYNFLIMLRARYRRIIFFAARILLSVIYWDLLLPRIGLRQWSQNTRSSRIKQYAASFRNLAVQMGGVLIKVGQFLSSRVDVLPPEFTNELIGLQDEVPPAPLEDIVRVAEESLGVPLSTKYASFERKPLAAASLGQVHRARLLEPASSPSFTGTEVVVKIQRPNIEKIIYTDMQALRTVGRWLDRYPPIRRRANIPALLKEFTRILYQEIDYLAEGKNAEGFAENFKYQPGVRVPSVIWTHTTVKVLTLENVLSIKITDYDSITQASIERSEVASRLLDTYLKQIFEDGFFHADPHPGNLFVNPLGQSLPEGSSRKREWELTFVDFGMVGYVPENLRKGLREMIIGIGTQNPTRVIESYKMMDILLPGANLDLLEKAVAREFDLFWGLNMTEMNAISFEEAKNFAYEFRELLYDLPFQMPQDAIFLARCVGILAGMCTGLDPDFNLFDHLAPYAQKLIADEARNRPEDWLREAEKFAKTLLAAPYKIDSILTKIDRGDLTVRNPVSDRQNARLERAIRQLAVGIVFAALMLGGIQLYTNASETISYFFFGGAAIAFLWMLASR